MSLSNLSTGGGAHLSPSVTGAKQPYRRKGIATALKVRRIAYTKEHRFATIRTRMLAINERPGFFKQLRWVSFVKAFN